MNKLTWMKAHTRQALVSAALLAGLTGQAQAQVADATLTADADTTVKELSPVSNFGAVASLRTNGLPRERTLVRFDQTKLKAAVNNRPVVSASLELTVQDVSLLFANNLAAHRISKPWTETGATWTCANDTTPTNSTNNCTTANAWSMTSGNGYASTPSNTQRVTRGQAVVKFNVTADVKAFLSGSQVNNGWLLKVVIEGPPGGANFRARESGVAPRLVLDLGGDAPGSVGAPCTTDAGCGGYANAVCFTEAELAIPGGYCSAWCTDNSQCPSSTACVQGACALPCNNGQCGAGYFCLDTGSAQACLPTCSSNADCTGGRLCENNNCITPE